MFTEVQLYPHDKNHRKKGIDADLDYEGEDLLTEDLRKELKGFPSEILRSKGYLITIESLLTIQFSRSQRGVLKIAEKAFGPQTWC